MSIYINIIKNWLNAHPQMKQWVWFIGLWCVGLLTVIIGSYPIKWLLSLPT